MAAIVVVCFLWVYFVCSYYLAAGENFKAKAWGRICRRQSFLDKISTGNDNFLLSPPWIAPVRGTIIEVKSTFQLNLHLVVSKLIHSYSGEWAQTTVMTIVTQLVVCKCPFNLVMWLMAVTLGSIMVFEIHAGSLNPANIFSRWKFDLADICRCAVNIIHLKLNNPGIQQPHVVWYGTEAWNLQMMG